MYILQLRHQIWHTGADCRALISMIVLRKISAGGKTDSAGAAQRRCAVTIVKSDSFPRQRVNMRCFYLPVPVTAKIILSQLVLRNDY